MPIGGSLTNFPDGFTSGLTVRGMPLLQAQPGNVFWVNNSSVLNVGAVGGSDSNRGTYLAPFSTLQYGLDSCTASRGDIIFVGAGHAETISSATVLALDKAGVAIIGMGAGSLRPTFTFTTATTANIPVTAANVSIQNCLFVANYAAVASVFTATSTNTPTDFEINNCEFRDNTSILNFVAIVTGNATANSMDGFSMVGCRISSLGTTAATTAIKLLEATRRVKVNGNFGNWAVLNDTAAMLDGSTFNHTDFEFGWNILNKPNTSSTGGSFVSGSGTTWTGHAHDNYCWQLDNDAGIWIVATTKLAFSQNFSPITGAAEKSGLINPAAV